MCVLVSASGTRMESACRPDHTPAMSSVCEEAAIKLRLTIEQACKLLRSAKGGGLQGACSSLPLTLACSVLAAPTSHQRFVL